ncbi:MAG: autotransporter assembly complex protein TamA [Rhodobacterales bacterium]|nr:autotransporter assembly complex protein TamA [Rhodobacterales bacterium]
MCRAAFGVVILGLSASMAVALDRLDLQVRGGDAGLAKALESVIQLRSLQTQGQTDPQDLLAAARSDYGRILAALYARGHYSVVVRISIDGREAADIRPLEAPSAISAITVFVDPGPPFTFGQTRIAPLVPRTALPETFRSGQPAESSRVSDAVSVSLRAWRDTGHAKVAVTDQAVYADHARAILDVDVALAPGPRLRFGPLAIQGQDRMRPARIERIAGLPEGETFSETELRRAETRLRRTGIFSSVILVEDEAITAPDLLGITATVVEQKPRRFSFGAEIASLDGVSVSGSWLHRNLLGGGERLKLESAITNIGSSESGVDYSFGVTLDRPATLTPDTTAGLLLRFDHLDDVDDKSDTVEFGLAFSHIVSDQLTLRAGLTYSYQNGTDPAGDYNFRNLSLPVGLTWDRRDNSADATSGFYIDATAKPFLGFDTTAYRNLGAPGRFVVAVRAQGGAIYGSELFETPRDDLFFSGGGGTVRGQPYRSLGVSVSRGFGSQFQIGGRFFVGGSLELRARVTDSIGVVGFVDAASIGIDGAFGDTAESHAGAGLGVRYKTPIGPIRLDVAAPVGGDTGGGVQFYIGLGQAF